jgi:hypothetical protein
MEFDLHGAGELRAPTTEGVSPELGAVVLDLLERAVARYGPDSDFTVVTKIVEAAAGLDPERASQPSI